MIIFQNASKGIQAFNIGDVNNDGHLDLTIRDPY